MCEVRGVVFRKGRSVGEAYMYVTQSGSHLSNGLWVRVT